MRTSSLVSFAARSNVTDDSDGVETCLISIITCDVVLDMIVLSSNMFGNVSLLKMVPDIPRRPIFGFTINGNMCVLLSISSLYTSNSLAYGKMYSRMNGSCNVAFAFTVSHNVCI